MRIAPARALGQRQERPRARSHQCRLQQQSRGKPPAPQDRRRQRRCVRRRFPCAATAPQSRPPRSMCRADRHHLAHQDCHLCQEDLAAVSDIPERQDDRPSPTGFDRGSSDRDQRAGRSLPRWGHGDPSRRGTTRTQARILRVGKRRVVATWSRSYDSPTNRRTVNHQTHVALLRPPVTFPAPNVTAQIESLSSSEGRQACLTRTDLISRVDRKAVTQAAYVEATRHTDGCLPRTGKAQPNFAPPIQARCTIHTNFLPLALSRPAPTVPDATDP